MTVSLSVLCGCGCVAGVLWRSVVRLCDCAAVWLCGRVGVWLLELPHRVTLCVVMRRLSSCQSGSPGTSGPVIGCEDLFGFSMPDTTANCVSDDGCPWCFYAPGCGGCGCIRYTEGGPGYVIIDFYKYGN